MNTRKTVTRLPSYSAGAFPVCVQRASTPSLTAGKCSAAFFILLNLDMEEEKTKIGSKAGTIWHKLNETGSITIPELALKLNIGVEDTTLAVGWLAREDKVFIERRNGLLYVRNQ